MSTRTAPFAIGAIALNLFIGGPFGTASAGSSPTAGVVADSARDGGKTVTRDDMLRSTPIAFPSHLPGGQVLSNRDTGFDAPVLTAAPGLPHVNANRTAAREFPSAWQELTQFELSQLHDSHDAFPPEPPAEAQCAPGWEQLDWCRHPYTSYWGNYWKAQQTRFPWKAVGKLLFQEEGEDPDVWHHCTAQAIGKDLIVTAGHCVFSPGPKVFAKNWQFVPAEKGGNAPYGVFKYKEVRVLARWQEGGQSLDDVALISLQRNEAGKSVGFYTGWLGLKLNQSYDQNLTLMGYSVVPEVPEGKWTTVNNGQSFQYFENEDLCRGLRGVDTLFIGSDLFRGSSGGAWINSFKPFERTTNGNYVVSVVSAGVQCNQPGPPGTTVPPFMLMGPRFSDANIGVLCHAMGGCGL